LLILTLMDGYCVKHGTQEQFTWWLINPACAVEVLLLLIFFLPYPRPSILSSSFSLYHSMESLYHVGCSWLDETVVWSIQLTLSYSCRCYCIGFISSLYLAVFSFFCLCHCQVIIRAIRMTVVVVWFSWRLSSTRSVLISGHVVKPQYVAMGLALWIDEPIAGYSISSFCLLTPPFHYASLSPWLYVSGIKR